MRKIIILICLIVFNICAVYAQNDLGSSDDVARIAITPYVDPGLGFNREVQKQLTNKMNAILVKQGIAGTRNQRFIISCNAEVLSEDIVVTTKEMYQYELNVNFIIGDGIEGTKFSMASQTVKGLGETKADAYIQALKKVKPSDPVFLAMVNEAKAKIIEYYNSMCDFIISEAKAMADKQDYDGAIYRLMSVPNVCKECYERCMEAVKPIYQAKIDDEGARFLAEARSIWNAGQDLSSADAAGRVLSKINPFSNLYAPAEKLSEEIAQRVKELDQREWDFKLRKYQDEVDFRFKKEQDEVDVEKERVNAMREIGVAYGENQQPVIYNIRTWW